MNFNRGHRGASVLQTQPPLHTHATHVCMQIDAYAFMYLKPLSTSLVYEAWPLSIHIAVFNMRNSADEHEDEQKERQDIQFKLGGRGLRK